MRQKAGPCCCHPYVPIADFQTCDQHIPFSPAPAFSSPKSGHYLWQQPQLCRHPEGRRCPQESKCHFYPISPHPSLLNRIRWLHDQTTSYIKVVSNQKCQFIHNLQFSNYPHLKSLKNFIDRFYMSGFSFMPWANKRCFLLSLQNIFKQEQLLSGKHPSQLD